MALKIRKGDTVQVMVPNQGGELSYEQGTLVSVFLPSEALRVLPV